MLSLTIAARFLRRTPGQSALIIAGIAVGIAVQVFVGSLITSLQDDLIESTVGSSPHVTLLPADGQETIHVDRVPATDDKIEVAVAVRRLSVISQDGDASTALSVTAGDPDDLDAVYGLADRLVDGRLDLAADAIVVGVGFATDRDVAVGDQLELLLPDGRTVDPEIAGIFDLGAAAPNDRFAFLGAEAGADALGHDADEYSAIEVQLADVFASTDVAERLGAQAEVTAVDWQDENEDLLGGLAAQSASSLLIQAFVLVAVALGIASTLAVSAVQKTRQIGILKAIGMGDAPAGRIFLWQGGLLGAGGTLGGIALGSALIWGFSFAPVPFGIRPEPGFIALSAAIGVSVALASAIIPVRSTSRLDPIEVIQGG